ncbi:MAG: carbohydrate kinase [Spirochaetes bacterium]|nr:carbohydrate kinase [Spirochaetota bacterium]
MDIPGARFVVLGEALTDLIRNGADTWTSRAGGACWNVARVASKLGLPTGFAGSYSNDVFGDELERLSLEAGLDIRYTQRVPKDPLLALVYQVSPPAYTFIGSDAADLAFNLDKLPTAWESSVEIAHFGSLGMVREPLATTLFELSGRLKARGIRISYDPNWRNVMGPDYRERFEAMIGRADFIKISDEDLAQAIPDLSLMQARERLRVLAERATVLYTRGEQGLELWHDGGTELVPAFAVRVADTVGAGDASAGGWLYSLLSRPGTPPVEHARFAAACAAAACTKRGAHAPSLDEVNRILEGAST